MADVQDKPLDNVENEEKTQEKKAENGTAADSKPVEKVGDSEKKDDEETNAEKAVEAENGSEKDDDAEKAEKEDESDGLSKLEKDIIRQVEYYFSDANLVRDKFLMKQIQNDAEGWVPLPVLMTFKRLSALSNDVEVIVDALLKSDENLLEISDDRTKLRRHPERPIPEHNEAHRKEVMSRTAYCKGFPLEAEIDEILEYFKPFEKVLNVTMRRYYAKTEKKYKFKGSVFATFEKKEQAEEFINKDGLSYKDRTLIRKWQDKYLVEKREEIERTRALKEKKKKNKANKPEEKKIELPKNTVLHFEGANGNIKREAIREAVEKVDGDFKVAYIEFRQGDKAGHIRFQEEGNANKFLEKLEDKKLKINDEVEITLRVLSEEEETEFLAKVVEDMLKMRNNSNKKQYDNRGGNRKRRFGGKFNNGKGKKQKFDGGDE